MDVTVGTQSIATANAKGPDIYGDSVTRQFQGDPTDVLNHINLIHRTGINAVEAAGKHGTVKRLRITMPGSVIQAQAFTEETP